MEAINYRCLEFAEIRKSKDGNRKMSFVASDNTRDSSRTVLNIKGWDLKRFNKNGIIGYNHNVYGSYSGSDDPDNIIGKGHAYIDGDKLMVDVEFEPAGMNELADKIYKKLEFGTLKAVSVGFRPLGKGHWGKGDEALGEKNETYYYAGQELLEVSIVNIPANPNALKRSAELAAAELEALKKEVIDANEETKDAETKTSEAEEIELKKAELNKKIKLAEYALRYV